LSFARRSFNLVSLANSSFRKSFELCKKILQCGFACKLFPM
jgi:hypothetical protein